MNMAWVTPDALRAIADWADKLDVKNRATSKVVISHPGFLAGTDFDYSVNVVVPKKEQEVVARFDRHGTKIDERWMDL